MLSLALGLAGLAAGLSLVLTRAARSFATRVGMVDRPDGHRKTQTAAVPVAGGAAVLAAALLALAGVGFADPGVRTLLEADSRRSLALLAAAVLIVLVGLADDRWNLRARHKLLGQAAAVLVLVVGGDLVVHRVGLFGWAVPLGPFAVPATALWLLACVNALNLIDGMDGLLGTVGVIALATLAVMAVLAGHPFPAAVALAVAGAVLGFLWWNLPPATVYMGDGGSMLVGLVVGFAAVAASLKGPAAVALGAPLAVVVLPMLDTSAAVVRRKLTGRGVATADRGHLPHVMLARGLTAPRVLAVAAGLGLVAAAGALASTAWHNDLFALLAAAGVVATLLAARLFGNAELGLIRARLAAAARGVWEPGRDARAWGLAVRLQGTADWHGVWADLVARAARLGLRSLRLDVNAPALHENFHARWTNPEAAAEARVLCLDVPLLGAGGAVLGRLVVATSRDDCPLAETFGAFADLFRAVELRAAAITARPGLPTPA